MKFIKPLSKEEQQTLDEAYRNHPTHRVRERAKALLLSSRGYPVVRLSEIFETEHETASGWIDAWEREGIVGLFDRPRSGRPRNLTAEEQEMVLTEVEKNPHQLKAAAANVTEKTGKVFSLDSLRFLLRSLGFIWKRCRRSCRHKRDEALFRRRQEVQAYLKGVEKEGKVNIFYFDETGFSTIPYVPYAWQKIGETYRIPSQRSKRFNVLGFFSRDNSGFFHFTETTVTTETVITAFDAFAEDYFFNHYRQNKIPCLVVLDNASVHTSAAFTARIEHWMLRGVALHFLPAYSPELNLIEILWRKVKYEWLPMDAYQSYEKLKTRVQEVFACLGGKFRITFA